MIKMKKLCLFTLLILSGLFFSDGLFAQKTDLYSYMDQYLSGDEKDQIARAKSSFDKGDKLESQIKEEDSKTSKFFQKKAKKGEKKTVDAKTYRIKQALHYEQGYVLIYSVYADKVGESSFLYEEDEAKVNNMLEEASSDNSAAKKKLSPYKTVTPKDLKSDVTYSKLKSDVQGMINLYESAIKKLIEAYTVVVDQDQKKQLEEEENRVWQNALSENTIYGYQSYLSDYPNGKYAGEARSKISSLEEIERKKLADKNRDMSNVVFHVQIAASKTKLPDWKIRSIYRAGTLKDVVSNYDNEWYRYHVGKFNNYEAAKAFVPKTKVKGAFVVVYRNGKKLHITEVVDNQ
jgi:hypothetical protein